MKRYNGYYTTCSVCKTPIDWDEPTCRQCHPEWLKKLQGDDRELCCDFACKVGIVVICVFAWVALTSL